MLDLVLIHPGGQHGIYGALGDRLTALEPPTWARMIAGYLRDRGVRLALVDAEALGLSPERVAAFVADQRPHLTAIVVSGHQPSASTQQMTAAGQIAREVKHRDRFLRVVMCGNHPSALPERTLREEAIDFVADGEAVVTIEKLLDRERVILNLVPGLVWREDQGRIVRNAAPPLVTNLDRDLHGDVWDLLPMSRYRAHNWHAFTGPRRPYASIYTTLGCPFSCSFCLSGDTEVNTIYGPIAISELVEQKVQEVPVFTLDSSQRGMVADAINIRQYGLSELVRVHFDDGSHLDCTPDHKLMRFTWSNGRNSTANRQWSVEARDLKPGDRVRSINFKYDKNRYPIAKFGTRHGLSHIHRLVAEWKVGRLLAKGEIVHHIDHDKSNWLPENIEVLRSHSEHASIHDFGTRVRDYWAGVEFAGPAPRLKLKAYQRAAIAREFKTKGLKKWWTEPNGSIHLSVAPRSPDAIQGKKNGVWWTDQNGKQYQAFAPRSPEDVRGRSGFNPHKNWIPRNHRVVKVEKLPGIHSVYCLDVPETGWFYANNVLVKNCMINIFQHSNRYRRFSPTFVADQVQHLHDRYGVTSLKIADEMFVLNEDHYLGVARELAARGLGDKLNLWAYARVDTIKPENLAVLRAGGVRWLALGIESASAHVRDGADKRLRRDDIVDVVRTIQAAGIGVVGNYIFGLRDDTLETMSETLSLALAANTEWANFYCAMAYPGSRLYDEALRSGWPLPATWRGYSQHNDDCRPLDTETVPAAEVLRFRDDAFRTYFASPTYRDAIHRKFGPEASAEVDQMLGYRLDRKLLV